MLDFKEVSLRLNAILKIIITDIVPGGKLNGSEYVAGSIRGGMGKSFSINMDTGVWKDFATGEAGGDIISLYAKINSISQLESAKTLNERYLSGEVNVKVNYPVTTKKPEIRLIKPPPEAEEPKLIGYEAIYKYNDVDGRVLFYIARKADKTFHPYSFSADGKWLSKAWPAPRPIYGLDLLEDKPVMIVEGEKTCEAARKLCHGYTVVTWPGGAQAWNKIDWSPLYNRKILLWPDGDKPGLEAMNGIYSLLRDKCPEIKMIMTDKQDGWDAADAIADGWDWKAFTTWAKPLVKTLDAKQEQALTPSIKDHTIESLYGTFPHQTGKALRPLSTLENFQYLMDQYGVVIRYNVITKDEEILIPGQSFIIDNRANASMSWVISTMAKHGMGTSGVNDFVSYMLGTNLYNPVVEWITSKPWDGINRTDALCNTITLSPSEEQEKKELLKKIFIKRWLISAVAAAFEPNGVSAHGVLVFQGDQNLGKTSWLKSLVPQHMNLTNDGVILRPDDKDSVKHAVSFWIIEFGELDATFKKSDIAQLKAFLTKYKDVLRRAYARRDSEYARRTVFFASVNPKQFLQDPTGNRRFWTIECEHINYTHGIDMQQLWAEVYENLYKKGESWYLSNDEINLLNEHNEQFTVMDEIEELICEKLAWESDPKTWQECSASTVSKIVGGLHSSRGTFMKIGAILRKKCAEKPRTLHGLTLYKIPNLKEEYQRVDQYEFKSTLYDKGPPQVNTWNHYK